MSERLIIVGDIHGCYHTLLGLLRKLDYVSRSDTLVFVGDYIDRGPWAFDVVRTLRGAGSGHMPAGQPRAVRH